MEDSYELEDARHQKKYIFSEFPDVSGGLFILIGLPGKKIIDRRLGRINVSTSRGGKSAKNRGPVKDGGKSSGISSGQNGGGAYAAWSQWRRIMCKNRVSE